MMLEGLISALSRARTFQDALAKATTSADFSVTDGLRAPLIAGLLTRLDGPRSALAITATSRESEALRAALAAYLPTATVVEFPAWETLPHERLSPSAETVGKRIAALRAMRTWQENPSGQFVLVASVRAALQPLADNLLSVEPMRLTLGGRGYDLAALSASLVDLAYTRVDMVTRRGEFAVRGGIVDVFAPTDEHPLRLEFFGDELEQLRMFSVADQRSLPEAIQSAELPPSRELLLSDHVRQRAREMQHEFPNLSTMLAKIGEGIPVEGMESLAPALLERLVPLTHYLPPDAAITVLSPERAATRAANLLETNREFLGAAWNAATAGAEAPIDLDAGDFVTINGLRTAAGDRPWWTLSTFETGAEDTDLDGDGEYLRVEASPIPSFAGEPEGALGYVAQLLRDGWSLAVTAEGAGLVDRAADVLAEHELSGREVEAFPEQAEPG
ncbi:MAG: transcription-repair coupling factor, partial [Salinibacterium sp.]